MTMRPLQKICLVVIIAGSVVVPAQTPRSGYDPADANHPSRQHDRFVDFALKQVNPQGSEYGQRLEDMRRIAIEATIDDYYCWSNLIAVIVLLIAFCIVLRQHALLKRRESSTARVISWYHNQLFGAHHQACEIAAKYAQLKRAIDHEMEASSAQSLPKGESGTGESEHPKKSVSGTASYAHTEDAQVLRETIKKLEQQAGRDKETLNSLRQQVSLLSRRLQEQQQKNRNVGGEIIRGVAQERT